MAPRKNKEAASWEVNKDTPKPQGETRPRRAYCVKELVTEPAPGVTTVHDLLLYAAKTHGDKKGFAARDVIKVITEEKEVTKNVGGKQQKEMKKWNYFKLSDYDWLSYNQFLDFAKHVGSGLRQLVGEDSRKEKFFNIYGQTSRNWMLVAQACAFNAVPISTAYDSLGPDGLRHALNEAEVRGMFTNADLFGTLIKVIEQTKTVDLIVYDGKADEKLLEQIKGVREGLKVIHLDEVVELGKKQPVEAIRAKSEDVYCCMYTSGSTGTPKGVLLTHLNVVSAVASVWTLLYEYLTPKDSYLAFLPLAHILEFVVENSFVFAGLPIGYGRVKTLTDASVRECKGDIAEFKPSIMVGVPAVWELIRKGILSKVDQAGGLKKSVFNFALKAKTAANAYGIPFVAGLTDAIVFDAVRAQTGGNLKIMFSGGGAVSKSTQQFLSTALVTMIQGYGLTESTAMAAILNPGWMQYGAVGGPVPAAEVKLVDAPEAGYLSTNDPPTGEILVRGPAIFKGYYKRPDLDKEAFTEDGWFRTGDVGQWNKDGTLSIIDRLKNLVKLSGGEYIAIEYLESIYKSCPLVANGAVIANGEHNKPAMVVVGHPQNLPAFAKKNGLGDSEDLEHLCTDEKVVEAALKELNAVGKKAGLKGMELLEAIVLVADEWTPESGFLTAAQKLQRKTIDKHYEDRIKAVYP
ncbi:long-chain acyl-CoA synthetase [Cryptococcus wingfieldii CBS 7118]|uniref:Long-chain acyl-CoA synthetase n=1 Tax=Cryptococcus wingfieldii CBS 7118 TaxID=1295528 RepID=A0A1E3K5E4_9TREE|nr:long-chain acyl-CoA synthetase [Cryptococcus wingfieldii CBS 7118]ODO08424.1 long-chain acyl-CoA synthetase [Cryptococcus wingfieldii CBS 7118]